MRSLLRQLENGMEQASRSQQYERAVRFRDSYLALKGLFERYAVFAPRARDMDIFAFHQEGNLVAVVRQALREGRLIASTDFIYDLKGKVALDPLLQADLIVDFYRRFHVASPSRVAVNATGSAAAIIRDRIRDALGSEVSIASPRGTETSRLLRFASENAEQKIIASTHTSDIPTQLSVLKAVLDLQHLPVRIEGYDVSNISGKDATVSMVVFVAGKPAKDQYRLFNIRSLDTPDDPAMMGEALERRFNRWKDIAFGDPADLILVDGGLTQLGAVCAVRDQIGVDVPVVGIAKKEELLFREGIQEPVRLSHDSGALLLLMAVRDEAHRFGKREFHKRHERTLRHR
jgi:excinuclease ABC subunit C